MKRLFGQRPKSSKSPSQASPIPTPVPADEFARAAQLRSQSQDDHWIVIQDPITGGAGPIIQDRSRSASFASLQPGLTPTLPGTNHVAKFQDSTPQQTDHTLIPSQNHNLKKLPTPMHGAPTIHRPFDPELSSLTRSTSPSIDSLLVNGEIDRERDTKSVEREFEIERERERQRGWERDRDREKGWNRDKERIRDSMKAREPERDRDQERGRERDKDRERPQEKEKKKGFFSSGKEREKDHGELTRMIGYLTATASENWSLVLEVCERASASEAAARDASKALRHEFRYAEPGAQLTAARLWAIMLRNCSDTFIAQASNKKFLDTIEDVLLSGGTSPVVRTRLLDVLAVAAFTHPGHGKEGYRSLWKKVKPPNMPDEGIPFDEDDSMLNPSPVPIINQYPSGRFPDARPSNRREVISASEDMRRLFEECDIGKGNAQLLSQALTFARPDELDGPVIGEWYRKCRNSQEFIMTQIPWATAQAERSREEARRLYLDDNGKETRPIPTSKEEKLLGALLGANEELLEAFRIYEDLERLGVAEREEREVEERSRKETKLDRVQINFIAEDGSFHIDDTMHGNHAGGTAGPSRPPSPSPAPSFPSPPLPQRPSQILNHPNQGHVPNPSLSLPRPTPHGPRQARPRSRTPSPDHPVLPPALVTHPGPLTLDTKRLEITRSEPSHGASSSVSDLDGERTPIVPSAKAMGKRRAEDNNIDGDRLQNSEDLVDGYASALGADGSADPEDESSDGLEHRWRKPMKYAYDAAADRARELRRDMGIPTPITNGYATRESRW